MPETCLKFGGALAREQSGRRGELEALGERSQSEVVARVDARRYVYVKLEQLKQVPLEFVHVVHLQKHTELDNTV